MTLLYGSESLIVHGWECRKEGSGAAHSFPLEGEIKTERCIFLLPRLMSFFPFLFSLLLMIENSEASPTGNIPSLLAQNWDSHKIEKGVECVCLDTPACSVMLCLLHATFSLM